LGSFIPSGTSAALLPVSLCLAMSACAIGPDYTAPALAAPSAWQAGLPQQGEQAGGDDWWARFDDANLGLLVAAAQKDSPSLAQAWAAIRQARATLATDRADGLPSVSAAAAVGRARTQGIVAGSSAVGNSRSVDIAPSWDIDLFGKTRRSTAAARARIAEREADWQTTRVALAAEVADDYVQYRGCRQLVDAYARSAHSAAETARVTAISVKAGLTATADGALADASEGSSLASLHGQQLQCVLLVKALVSLTGLPEPALRRLLDAPGLPELPRPARLVVPSVPADVLRQRPDIASLEREVAATSEEIGVAGASRYPSLSLSGLITLATSAGLSATTWSFGPGLSATLFDAGKGAAGVDSARAAYDSAVAGYRAGVRSAVKDVEQALAELAAASQREDDARQAADGYQRSLQASESLWRAGNADLLSLEVTRRSAIAAEVDLITLRQAHVQYWIALHKALGGGWRPDLPAQAPQTAVATASNPVE
jgi:NodT family efflux transporter outer membrane factor (OMF) lipoprotein